MALGRDVQLRLSTWAEVACHLLPRPSSESNSRLLAVTTLKVADIVANSGVQSSHLDAQQVETYRRSVDRLPPVVVFETEEGLLLADGYHRLAAAVAEGKEPSRLRCDMARGMTPSPTR